jgi:hypothetical protein
LLNFHNLAILVGKKMEKILQIQKKWKEENKLPKNQNHKFQRKKAALKPHNQHVFLVSNFPNLAILVGNFFFNIEN